MNCSTKNIFVIVALTLLSVFVILGIVVYFVFLKSSGSSAPASECGNLLGVWVLQLDDSNTNQKAVLTIGKCFDDSGNEASYVDSEYPDTEYLFCGSLFVVGIDSNAVGSEVYCTDCKFTFISTCNIQMLSRSLQKFVGSPLKTDPIFKGNGDLGWIIDCENGTIETKYGTYTKLNDEQFTNTCTVHTQPQPNTKCEHKIFQKSCGEGSGWTKCTGLGGCCCGDTSCCKESDKKLSFLDYLGFV